MRRTALVAAALLALGAVGCGTDKLEKKAADSDAAAKAAAERATAAEAKIQELEGQLAATKKELDEATQARDALQTQTATLQEEKGAAEAKSKEYEELSGSLKKEIENGQIEISELRGKMTVKLKDKILFPSGSAKLSRDGKAALDAVAESFKSLKDKNVVVAGYTDDVRVAKGLPFEDNWDLSSARAIAVVRYLASKGVPPEMMGAIGFSQFRPVAPNDSPANRSQNRRIEIALTAADYQAPEVEAH